MYMTNPIIMVIDLETSGLPTKYIPYSNPSGYDSARMVSICWRLYKEDGSLIKSQYYIIKPVGFCIPFYATKIHGISNCKALKQGKEVTFVLNEMYKDVIGNKIRLVAHNIFFDKNVLLSEIHRVNPKYKELESIINNCETFCTMQHGAEHTKIETNRGGGKYKNPKLIELYNHFFPNSGGFNQHNALDDTIACAKCYFKIINPDVMII